jgi:hypothetical protein
MTIFPFRAVRLVPAAVLAVLVLSACSFHGSVSAATSSAAGASGSAGSTSGVVAAGTSTAGAPSGGASGAGSSSAGAASSPAGTPAARTDRCHTSELAGSFTPESAGAGQRYATLILRNTGGRTCTVHGFGGLGLAGSDGHALPTHQVRAGGPAATVRLAPGGAVRSALHWSAVNGPGDPSSGACQPAPATLRVIPPDETGALSAAWSMGPVCSAGTIEQHPYAP